MVRGESLERLPYSTRESIIILEQNTSKKEVIKMQRIILFYAAF
jgi:hypothetical protein